MPTLYMLAGCNGAGKTTAAYALLSNEFNVREFVNADEIARGLSPFNAESVAFEAGRLMIQRVDYLMNKGIDFALETTLSSRSYVQTIKRAQQQGYHVRLYYIWLESAHMAQERVAIRVSKGGHNIPDDVIERRYERSVSNLLNLYVPICDSFSVINNSGTQPEFIAQGGIGLGIDVFDEEIWTKIKTYENA